MSGLKSIPHEQPAERAPENQSKAASVVPNSFEMAKMNPDIPEMSRWRSLVIRTSTEPDSEVCPLLENVNWRGAWKLFTIEPRFEGLFEMSEMHRREKPLDRRSLLEVSPPPLENWAK
jgi:hypothetical protein